MRIGIDARLLQQTGVGRYIQNLIRELAVMNTDDTYIIFLTPEDFDSFICPSKQFIKRKASPHWHTLQEQILLPFLFLKEQLDILHEPYITIPIFYPKKMVVTIHDLTVITQVTGKASTLPFPLYFLKVFASRLILTIGLWRANHILAVSESTKQDVINIFHINPKKISVTYEGVDPVFSRVLKKNTSSPLASPYFLYVGNAYPHKNVERLVDAFFQFHRTYPNYKLVLLGKNDIFYVRVQRYIEKLDGMKDVIRHIEYLKDDELQNYYRHAEALVFPSHNEGFGLPALEALSFGCTLICSDIPVFREIFGDIPLYFPSNDTNSLVMRLIQVAKNETNTKRKTTIDFALFRWDTMAQQTYDWYRHIGNTQL